jgi:hypothetical protein
MLWAQWSVRPVAGCPRSQQKRVSASRPGLRALLHQTGVEPSVVARTVPSGSSRGDEADEMIARRATGAGSDITVSAFRCLKRSSSSTRLDGRTVGRRLEDSSPSLDLCRVTPAGYVVEAAIISRPTTRSAMAGAHMTEDSSLCRLGMDLVS